MRRVAFFLPLTGLILLVAYVGYQRGQIPSDTEIINSYAAAYLAAAPKGASPTDCAAAPHPNETIRMVISCAHPAGLVTTYFVGPRGAALAEPQGPAI